MGGGLPPGTGRLQMQQGFPYQPTLEMLSKKNVSPFVNWDVRQDFSRLLITVNCDLKFSSIGKIMFFICWFKIEP